MERPREKNNNQPKSENQSKFEYFDQRFKKIPNTIATYGKYSINKQEAFELLISKNRNLEKLSDAEILDMLKNLVNEKIYLNITKFFLERYGFTPSYKMAYDYLNQASEKLPNELKKLQYKDKNIEALASDENFQLTVATLFYLNKHFPEKTAVSDDEIEFFYRANQNEFVYDEKIDMNFIAVPKSLENSKNLINRALSLLKQGVAFSKVAEDFNKALSDKYYNSKFQAELVRESRKLDNNSFSDIIELSDVYAILQLKEKVLPKYIPLAEASFFIKSTIEAKKCSIELENILEKALQSIEIVYFF